MSERAYLIAGSLFFGGMIGAVLALVNRERLHDLLWGTR